MKITREYLIELCDRFLKNEIDKPFIKDFAWEAISNDEIDWDEDDIISETIFNWDNEEINFEINQSNMELWKNRLITGIDNFNS